MNLTRRRSAAGLAIIAGILLGTSPVSLCAADVSASPTVYGPLGLNIVPSARMDEQGTIRAGVSALDPYAHGWLGFQFFDALSVTLRQTAMASDLRDDADRLYPGLDLKLRLLDEGPVRPALAIGIQAAAGHKRMAGEYVVASKRWRNFDFTGGIGWGRYGSAMHAGNPLGTVAAHFGKNRSSDGEMPVEPDEWFTGDRIGIFGGVEYFTPVDGLSLKFDYSADRFGAETANSDFDSPAPWSAGVNYSPLDWIDIALATQGTDKIMARVSLQDIIAGWNTMPPPDPDPHKLRAYRTGLALPGRMELSAQQDGLFLQGTNAELHSVSTFLVLDPHSPAPDQIGRAAINMANHAGPEIGELVVTPTNAGLRGPSVRLMRRDLEQALLLSQGSPEEIWRNASFDHETKSPLERHNRFAENISAPGHMSLTLDTRTSLSEEDSGSLYRVSAVTKFRAPRFMGLIDGGIGLRLNISDNLHHLAAMRPLPFLPVRSDVHHFAQRRLALEDSYIAYTHSLKPGLHLALIGGYLEEMYAGAGGEALYRPFGSRLALGAEIWLALKRDPLSTLNLALSGDHLLTGHINAWYDAPFWDITLKARAGRYLAQDIGATLGLQKDFANGAKLEGFVTLTDNADLDLFGGTTHAYSGVRLSVPLGGIRHMPREVSASFRAEPFGRDTGQSIETPLSLYEMTGPFSYPHMARHWQNVTGQKKAAP